jgi:TonB family protein
VLIEEHKMSLRRLSSACGGWIVFDDETEETWVATADWEGRFTAWQRQQDSARNGGSLRVSAKVCVHPEGFVYRVDLVESSNNQEFDEDLRTKVRRWRYDPYVKEGRPVPFCYVLNYSYELRR